MHQKLTWAGWKSWILKPPRINGEEVSGEQTCHRTNALENAKAMLANFFLYCFKKKTVTKISWVIPFIACKGEVLFFIWIARIFWEQKKIGGRWSLKCEKAQRLQIFRGEFRPEWGKPIQHAVTCHRLLFLLWYIKLESKASFCKQTCG